MEFEDIIYEKEEHIAIIKLNRPNVLNAVRDKLWREIEEAVADVKADDNVRILIFTGEGRAFSAGADLKETKASNEQDPGASNTFAARDGVLRMQRLTRDIIEMPKPTIAAVNGYALGAGAELAILCDIRIMSQQAQFGFPEVKVGLFETNGVTHILPRMVGLGKAKELMMTGDFIDAEESLRIGLVQKVVPHEKLMEETKAMAAKIAANAPISVSLVKTCLNKGAQGDLDTALVYETEALMATRASEDMREGALAFNEKRPPQFKGR
jgi:enoyl-CoA hydratase